jgi:hypothetical protein
MRIEFESPDRTVALTVEEANIHGPVPFFQDKLHPGQAELVFRIQDNYIRVRAVPLPSSTGTSRTSPEEAALGTAIAVLQNKLGPSRLRDDSLRDFCPPGAARLEDIVNVLGLFQSKKPEEAPDPEAGVSSQPHRPTRVPPLAYLRAVLTLAWHAFRHPFTPTTVDLFTGRVIPHT